MPDSTWALLISLMAAGGTLASVIGQLVKIRRDARDAARDDNRDDAKVYSDVALNLVNPLRESNQELRLEMGKLKADIAALQTEVQALRVINGNLRAKSRTIERRAQYYQQGAVRLYHQVLSKDLPPVFDPLKGYGDIPTTPLPPAGGE